MIRLPSSRILLTEADVNHHLQRILLNRALLSMDLQHDDIDSQRHRDLYLRTDGLPPLKMASTPSPLSWSSSSTCSLDLLPSDDVEDEAQLSRTAHDFSIYAQGHEDIVANTVQLVNPDFNLDPYDYGMGSADDARMTTRRRVDGIPWPSLRAQVSGSSQLQGGGTSLPARNSGLEALDTPASGVPLPNIQMPPSSGSSNPSVGKHHISTSRSPKTSLLADFRLSALGNQLDHSIAGFPSQQVRGYRHAAVRKSSLLRFAQNATSEQITDEMTDDEVGIDGTQERNGLPEGCRESLDGQRHGNHPYKNFQMNSGTLDFTDNYLSRCIPNLSIKDGRNSPSGLFPEIPSGGGSSTIAIKQQQSPEKTDSSRQDSSSLYVGSNFLETSSSPPSMSLYFPTSYVRTRLPGDPDSEHEVQVPREVLGERAKVAGTAAQFTHQHVPETSSSGESSNDSKQSSHALSSHSISDSSIEEEVLGPFIDRQFSARPSIFAPSPMDVEMRRKAKADQAERAIRQRLAKVVHAFMKEEESVAETSDTEIEDSFQSEDADEQVGDVAGANGLQADGETSSATDSGREGAEANSASTLLSASGDPPTTPNHPRGIPRCSPTSLPPSNQIQREIQVYDDRRPDTVQRPAAQTGNDHALFAPGYCRHGTAPPRFQCCRNSSHCSHGRPIIHTSPSRVTSGYESVILPPLHSPSNDARFSIQSSGTTSLAQGYVNHTGTASRIGATNTPTDVNRTRTTSPPRANRTRAANSPEPSHAARSLNILQP